MDHHDHGEARASQQGPPGREVSVRLELLDAQIIDADDLPIGRVDDLEIDLGTRSDDASGRLARAAAEPRLVALLVGQRHLGPRVGGITGELMARTGRRLSHDPAGGRVEPEDVASWSGMLKLRRRLADLDLAPLEKWLSARVVRLIPGGDDEGL